MNCYYCELLKCRWESLQEIASRYIRALARVCIYVVSECAPTCPFHLARSLAGWARFGWNRGTGAASLGSCSGGCCAARTCSCCWLWRVLLAISRMLCSVAVSGVMLPTVPDRSRLCRRERRMRSTYCCGRGEREKEREKEGERGRAR